MKTWNKTTTTSSELSCFWRPEELQLLAEVVLMQLAIEAVLSIHLDREPTTLVDQENHVHLKGLWDKQNRGWTKKGVLNELQNRLWSSLREVLTAESPNSLNKENKLVIQPLWRDVDSSYLHLFWIFTSFDSHLWDYPRQTSILHQPEFFAKFPQMLPWIFYHLPSPPVGSAQSVKSLWKLGELLPDGSSATGDLTVSVGLKDGKGLKASRP